MRLSMKVLGHPGLRQKSLPIVFASLPVGLIDGMIGLLHAETAEFKSTGLSAPQVGDNVRVFIMADPNGRGFETIINPAILRASTHKTTHAEGCTSIPNMAAFVTRPHSVAVEYTNRRGTRIQKDLTGLWARTFQHECDHLDGILMVDRVADPANDVIPIPELVRELEDANSKLWNRISPENR